MRYGAIVVTFNRKKLLEECIDSLLNQTLKLDNILIFDNASTDGTDNLIQEKYSDCESVIYFKSEKNLGGAGGFSEGLKKASELNLDWIWIMDDDTIPLSNSLEKLSDVLETTNEEVSFLASYVVGEEGEPMNVPVIDMKKSLNGYKDWYLHLDKTMVKIEAATFVSILVNSKAISKVGFPFKEYFLWGDDFEYTYRLTNYFGPAYMVGNSKVIHKRKNAKTLSVLNENSKERIKLYRLFYRNNLINTWEYKGKLAFVKMYLAFLIESLKALKQPKYGFTKFLTVHRGIYEFVFRKYDTKAFKKRFEI